MAGVVAAAFGTLRHPPSFHVAGVVLGDIDLHFVWQAWHVWHWAGSGGALGPEWHLRFTWQAWYLVTSTFTLCGSCGTYGIGLAPVVRLGRSGRGGRRGCWRGRRGALRHPPSFHLAGVVLGDIGLHFVGQAWRVWHWAGSGGALELGPEWPGWPCPPFTLRGSSGTYGIGPRGSPQRRCRCHMPLGFIWQTCNWRRLSGLCERPRLSVVVRDVRCGCSLVLDLIRLPCAVYTVYSQGS